MGSTRDSGEFASPPPRRWLDDASGATDAERAVLRTGVSIDPPAGADRKIWMAIAAKIGPVGGGGGGAGGPGAGTAAAKGAAAAASAAAAGGGLLTSALIGGACAVALLVGSSALETDRPSTSAKPSKHEVPAIVAAPKPIEAAAPSLPQAIDPPMASAARVDPSAAPSAAKANDVAPARSAEIPNLDPGAARGSDVAPAADPGGSGVNALDPGAAVGSGDAASRLREESQLLSQARDALHSGDVARCFGLLETARTRFASGGLGQEREALTIEALARSGNSALASERANAFLRTFPNSPHAARVKTFAQ